MKQMKLVLKLATTFFAAFLIFATLSCEVGLGSAVDTERPDLAITYPPKGAIIKDSFTLAGTVADDVGVTFINVVLTHKTLKTEYVYKSSEGQVNIVAPANGWAGGTTWTATIGKKTEGQKLFNGWDLPDGDYFIDVEAADVEGSVYDRRSITIDNTPPVCIIENLTSLGTENNADRLSTFGQKVNLSGKIKDDTGVSKVFFDVYDENKNLVGSSSMDYDFSPDGLLLAQYKASKPENEKEKILAQNYNMLYGLKENQKLPAKIDPTKDIKTRYMTFRLSDNARVYNEPVFTNSESSDGNGIEGTGEGNITTEIYLNTQAFGLENITIDELNEYRKHLVVDEEMDAKIARIASNSVASVMLGSNGDFSKITKMQINPEIDPKWYVGSYEVDGTDYELAFIGSTLTVMFAAGYDNVQFKPSNIRIVLAKLEKDASGTYKIVASDNELRNQTIDTDDVIVLKNYGGSEELTLNLTQPVSLSSESIKSQSCYRIMVFGKDGPLGNGLDFKEKNNGWYGIKATKNATPPRITFLNENEDSWIGPDTESFQFKFKIGIDGDKLVQKDDAGNETDDKPTVTVSITDSNGTTTEDDRFVWEETSSIGPNAEKLYEFDWLLKNNTPGAKLPMPANEGNYKLIIKVEAQDDSEGYASSTFKLNIDKEKPKPTIGTANPYINAGGKDYLNGTVEIPVSIKDNQGVDAASYKVVWGGSVSDTTGTISLGAADANGYRNGKIILNTLDDTNSSKVSNGTQITLYVTAKDKYGNSNEISKVYTVDQTTDIPKLEFANLDSTADYIGNSFGLTSGNKISASVSDDDGKVKTIEAKVWGVDSSSGTDVTKLIKDWTTMNSNVSGVVDFNFYDAEIIKLDGRYQLKFRVTDSVGNLSTSVKEFGPYKILVDGSAPIFKNDVNVVAGGKTVAADGNYYYIPKEAKTKVTLELTEGNLATVTVNESTDDVVKTLKTGSTTDWTVTYTWTPTSSDVSGEKELMFVATDTSGNSKEKTVSLFYDKDPPELASVSATPVLTGDVVNGDISFKGSVSDNDIIKSVVVTASNNPTKELYNGKASTFEITEKIATKTITADDTPKNITFTVVATDRAGNVTTKNYPYTINQMTDQPEITFDDKIDESLTKHTAIEAATDGKNMFGLKSNNVLTGSASDDDGIKQITIIAYEADGTTRVNSSKTYTTTSSSFNCNIYDKLGITTAGNYVVAVTADDILKELEETAYASFTKEIKIVVDGVAPVIENIEVAGKAYRDVEEAFIKAASTVSFDVDEAHLKSVTINGAAVTPTGTAPNHKVTYLFTTAELNAHKNSSVPFKIVAEDKSGYITEKELNIFYDVDVPVINKLELEKQITTYKADKSVDKENNVNGVITITGNIGDNDAIASGATEVKILDGANEVANVVPTSLSDTNFSFTVDTTKLTDKHEYKLSVTTKDRAGNETTEEIPFYVNQATDMPSITFTNADATKAAGENKFGIEGWEINGIVEDDDGEVQSLKVGSTSITVAQSGAFKYTIPDTAAARTSGVKSVTFTVVDKKSNPHNETRKTADVTLNYVVDTEVPKFGEIKLYNGTESSGTTTYEETGTAYYSGMFAKEYHKFEFPVSDDNEVEKVEVKVWQTEPTSETEPTDWTNISDTLNSAKDKVAYTRSAGNGTFKIKFRLTDKYGHQSSVRELEYKVDTVSPDITGITTKVNGKDITDDDYPTTWFANSLSSVDMSGIKDANLSADVSAVVSGNTALSDSFQMTVNNTASPKTGNFNRAITFEDGTSTVVYTFSDEAGNKTNKDVVVNVDTTAPKVSAPSITGTGLSSDPVGVTKNDITAHFTASDEKKDSKNNAIPTSQLKEAVLGPSANFTGDGYGKVPLSGDSQSASKDITISDLEDGTHQVWVRVTDKAGNTSADYEIGSFIKDTTPPVVTIESHSNNATVNKIIKISGKASDANPTDEVIGLKIYAVNGSTKGDEQTASGLITINSSSFASWEYEVNTEKLTDGESYIFEVTAKDKAGNEVSGAVTLKVDQDSDRPVVTLNQINIGGATTLPTGKINWDVTDDDGTPEYVKITVEKKDGDSWKPVESGETITPSGTSYVYPSGTDKLADGNYRLSFEIKDNGIEIKDKDNTTFKTGDSSGELKQPKIQTTGVSGITGDSISFAVDGTPPTINSVMLYMDTGKTDSSGNPVYETTGTEINGGFYGGTKKQKGKIVIDAEDNVLAKNELKYYLKLNDSYVVEDDDPPSTEKKKKDIKGEYLIDFSTCANGGLTMTFEVEDNSGAPATKTATVFVDNLAPNADGKAVTNMRPVPTAEVTGIVEVTANISDDTTVRSGIDSSTVAYYIPKSSETDPKVIENDKWIYAVGKDGKLNFEVTDILMKFKLSELTKSDTTDIADGYEGYEDSLNNKGIYNIPIWIKLSDIVGNTSYVTENTIKYNPDADRPRIKVLDPAHNLSIGSGASKKDYVILGGNIRISGSAEDDEGIEGVYVQYDINGDGYYNGEDVTWLESKGYTIVNPIPGTGETHVIGTDKKSYDGWGVKAKNTMSWQATFKASDLTGSGYDLEVKDGNTKTLNIRVCAADTDSVKRLVSAWSEEIHVSVNNGIPSFNDMQLVKYTNTDYTTEVQRIDYSDDMYISDGYWRLEGFVGDDGGITKIDVTGSQNGDLTTETSWFVAHNDTTSSLRGYKIFIPVNKDTFKLKIVAYDNTDKTPMKSTSNFSVYIDKKAPEFDGTTENDLVLWLTEYGEENGELISEKTKVQNSNGRWTTIVSKVTDADSGFEKAIFYLLRKGAGNKNRVYNVMQSNERTNLYTENEGIVTVNTKTTGGVYIDNNNLPVLEVNATKSNATTFVVSQTGIGANNNIRRHGAVRIGDFYRIISDVTPDGDNKITVTLTEGIDTAYTKVSFVYGMVVDKSGENLDRESGTILGDDGDGMAESITKSGTDYIWDATFDSTHIPDGPVEIHVVVFDKVGNKRHGFVNARVSNNSPRLARVKLGTDLNGINGIEDSEPETVTFLANSNYKDNTDAVSTWNRADFNDVWNLDTQSPEYGGDYWKIKNGLKVTPEFVGGTGSIWYVFSKVSGIGNNTHLTTAEQAVSPTKLNGSITLTDSQIGTNLDDQVNTYRFSFWDETEETTKGKDSGWAVLNAELYQDITDNNRPKPIIHPFFWKKSGVDPSEQYNSIQWKTESDGTYTALGHIELEKDLTGTKALATYGADPKVSGKIVLRGTVYDETRLTEVNIKSSDNKILDNKTLIAKYDTSKKKWTTTGNATGYTFTVEDVHGIKQIGHLVKWTLEVDTEKVSNVAKQNVTFTVQGSDGSKDNNNNILYSTENTGTTKTTTSYTSVYATTAQAEKGKYYTSVEAAKDEDKTKLVSSATIRLHSPRQFKLQKGTGSNAIYEYRYGTSNHYQMDVVPYVTKVTTSLSSKDVNNPSKYDRTSLGHYPVQSVVNESNLADPGNDKKKMTNTKSEEVKLYGFNLHGTISVTNGTGSAAIAPTATELGYIKFDVSNRNFKTGELSATVGDIQLLNNINNNNANGDATDEGEKYVNWYNFMANGDNNDNLTDDIVFDVWEFNDRVAEPNKASIEGTVMKVNSKSNMIQYAYSDGTFMVMGSGQTNSGRRVLWGWDTYQGPSIGFHIDTSGATYGCGHASDTSGSDLLDFFRFVTSKQPSYQAFTNPNYPGDRNESAHNVTLERTGELVNNKLVIERQRIWSPSIGTTGSGDNVNIYMAYYDQLNDELRFRAGKYIANYGTFGMFTNLSDPQTGKAYNLNGAKLIASSKTSFKPGRYVSLAARKDGNDDIVCIVWFDAQANKLRYVYQKMASADVETATADNWNFTNSKTLFDTVGGGQYCQIAFDADGGVHVAAYAGNDHVWYAYATGYDKGFKEYRVDATDGVGQNLTLDVAFKNITVNNTTNKKPIPYIGYYNNTIAKPKYAYLTDDAAVSTEQDGKAGVDENGRYTENWNISVLPTKSALHIKPEDKINVGVWKTDAGVLKNSVTGTSSRNQCSDTGGKTYGNGTSNAVLLYQIVDSTGDYVNCLESAQLR